MTTAPLSHASSLKRQLSFKEWEKKEKHASQTPHPLLSTTTTYPDRYSLFICHPAAICTGTKLRLSHTVIITAYIQDPLCTVY